MLERTHVIPDSHPKTINYYFIYLLLKFLVVLTELSMVPVEGIGSKSVAQKVPW